MTQMQRTFFPGSHWLYFKIYTGFKTTDLLITDVIAPLAGQLLNSQVINKWFFIRYSDPELHLRLRFYLNDTDKIGVPILMLNHALQKYLMNDLVWKIQLDTYQREVERYGVTTMELSESIFFYDSHFFADILRVINEKEDETFRWFTALASIDALLNDFSYELQQKIDFITLVKNNFAREFGLENSRSQLSNRYRSHKKEVEDMLEIKDNKHSIIRDILDRRSKEQKPVADKIRLLVENDKKLHTLLSSYTHMMINRWFRSKQRMYEAVLYDFLFKYYKSKMALKNT